MDIFKCVETFNFSVYHNDWAMAMRFIEWESGIPNTVRGTFPNNNSLLPKDPYCVHWETLISSPLALRNLWTVQMHGFNKGHVLGFKTEPRSDSLYDTSSEMRFSDLDVVRLINHECILRLLMTCIHIWQSYDNFSH